MDQILKGFLGILLLAVLMFTGAGMVSGQWNARQADGFRNTVVGEIEDSHFSVQVMEECKALAKERGYELVIPEESKIYDAHHALIGVEVVLRYPYKISFLGIDRTQELTGYAR